MASSETEVKFTEFLAEYASNMSPIGMITFLLSLVIVYRLWKGNIKIISENTSILELLAGIFRRKKKDKDDAGVISEYLKKFSVTLSRYDEMFDTMNQLLTRMVIVLDDKTSFITSSNSIKLLTYKLSLVNKKFHEKVGSIYARGDRLILGTIDTELNSFVTELHYDFSEFMNSFHYKGILLGTLINEKEFIDIGNEISIFIKANPKLESLDQCNNELQTRIDCLFAVFKSSLGKT